MKVWGVTILGAIASGLMLCLALPPADTWWIAWIAFAPLLAAVRGRGFLAGFGGGLLAMLVCGAAAQAGIFYADKDMSGSPAWIAAGCGLFGFVVSISTGIWADRGTVRKPAIWFAALAVVLEAFLLIKLPAHIALTQYRQPTMLILASWGGIWLVSLLIWGVNFWVANRIVNREYRWLVIVPLALVATTFVRWPETGETLAVAAIQTDAIEEQPLIQLHQEASQGETRLAVWPEFSGMVLAPGGKTSELERLAAEPGSAALVTTFEDTFAPLPHNVSVLISEQGVSARYFKRHLIGGEVSMHTAGTRAVAADFRFAKVGLAICYDSCFPATMRETATNVDVITLPSIDPPSPHHFLAAAHAAFTPFRAAETGVPIVRADGFGHSMIVDCYGQILAELASGEGVIRALIPPPRPTIAMSLGDSVLYMCAAFTVLGFFLFRSRAAG